MIVFGIFFATPGTEGQKKQNDEPTIVQLGQVSDKERAYSEEYKKFYPERQGKDLTKENEPWDTRGVVVFIGPYESGDADGAPVITPIQFFERLSCQADAIISGTSKSSTSHLSADRSIIYSSYNFEVKRIFKNNFEAPIEISKALEITRPGGSIKVGEQFIKFQDYSYKQLDLDKDYLLFLKFVPATDGYIAAGPEGDFALDSKSFNSLSTRELPDELAKSGKAETLSNVILSAVSNGCVKYLPRERK